jgi:RNA polymerase sigma factor (sigma-70 family)
MMARACLSVAEVEDAYRRLFAPLVRVAHAVTRDRESAVDAVQEAFASALAHRRSFRGEGPVDAWISRAVVNNARKSLRARPSSPAEIGERDPFEEPPAVIHAIRQLPERQRLVLFLRHYADLDYRTIATTLGIEVGTVSATLSAAHANLRTAIGEAGHAE